MITCKYSCPECGIVDQEVQVPARQSAQVDVVQWMEKVVFPTIGEDHKNRSPKCNPKELKNLMVPTPPEAEFIGQQIE
jgi:hypothetical protein